MVSERYPRDEDEDLASAYDSENCEEDESDDIAILGTQDLESSTPQDSILFGSFASPIIPVSIPSIALDSDGFSIKIGEITCFLGDSCCSDVDFTITALEGDKQLKNFESEFVLSVVSQRLQNQSSVKEFSSPIKVERQYDGNVDQDQNNKKGEMISDLLLCSSESFTFFSHHRGLCITIFDPGGTMTMIYSSVTTFSFLSKFVSCCFIFRVFVFDPGGNHCGFCSSLFLLYRGILDRADTIFLLVESIHGEIVVLGNKIKIQLKIERVWEEDDEEL
jgi:hypothetical protein